MATKLGIFKDDRWTNNEIEIIKTYYPTEGSNICKRLPNRTIKSIMAKAHKLKIIKEPYWKNEEELFLKNNSTKYTLKELSKILNKTESSISSKCFLMNIKFKKDDKKWWDENEIEILKKYYPTEGLNVVKRLPNKTEKQCKIKIHQMKLKIIPDDYMYVYSTNENKYKVSFSLNKKKYYFGTYNTKEEAANIAREKAKEYGKPWVEPKNSLELFF